MYCWGRGDYGQLGNGNTEDQPTSVEASQSNYWNGSIATGGNHTCALSSMNPPNFKCWGSGSMGQLGNGTFVSKQLTSVFINGVDDNFNVKSVAAGEWRFRAKV